jgi:hypothetical protein
MERQKYTIRRYGVKAWEVCKWDAKQGRYVPFKYPGNVWAAAEMLVDLHLVETGKTHAAGLSELGQALRDSVSAVAKMLQEIPKDES